jgi:hypothetical protein
LAAPLDVKGHEVFTSVSNGISLTTERYEMNGRSRSCATRTSRCRLQKGGKPPSYDLRCRDARQHP